jgi:UDP-GlcNAc:undecaprenyl-phosphate GlcNAc-1-phosphate transferase
MMASFLLLIIVGSTLAGFLGAIIGTGVLVRRAMQWELLDDPDEERKIHVKPTPTSGGIGIAMGVIAGGLILLAFSDSFAMLHSPPFVLGALLMLGAGFWDDRYGLNVKAKFLLQIIAAYLLLHAGSHFNMAGLVSGENLYGPALYSIPLSIIWVVGVINAVNLIDGLDGLATGVVAISFLACATILGMNGHLGLMAYGIMIVGALGGFLWHNFNPASIFMGDSGSLFLGYLLAGYTMQAPLHSEPLLGLLIPPLLIGLPVLDTGVAIVRRLLTRQAVFAPDRYHIHHLLVDQGSERSAVLILYMVAILFGCTAILASATSLVGGSILVVGTGVVALLWVWRLGCFHPVFSDDATEASGIRAPELLSWKRPLSKGAESPPDSVPEEDQEEKALIR